MKKLIYLFITTLGIISCRSGDETVVDEKAIANSDLIGKWDWICTKGGIGDHINEAPETTEKIIQLTLNENYTYSIVANGIEISSGPYQLIMKKSIYSGEWERFIQIPENQQSSIIVTKGIIKTYEADKLNISDNNYDGIGSGFIKIDQ